MDTKICTKCGEEKNLSEFSFRKDNNKFRNECKKCRSLIECNNRKENIELYKKRSKVYYINNKEKILKSVKQYYEKNKEKIKEKGKRYYIKNKERIDKRNVKYHTELRQKNYRIK